MCSSGLKTEWPNIDERQPSRSGKPVRLFPLPRSNAQFNHGWAQMDTDFILDPNFTNGHEWK
jgi:hypothetical protein